MSETLHTSLIGKNAQFDSSGQPLGKIVAVWLDGNGVLMVARVLATGPSVVDRFLDLVVVP